MIAATHHKIVLVEVLDSVGDPMGRAVAVEVFYATERYEYGADADGRRGVPCEDVTVLDVYANPAALAGLNSEQVEQVLDDARRIVEKGAS
jgi:hypothetical protein